MSELNDRPTANEYVAAEQGFLPSIGDLQAEARKVVNVASVKHRSPFRYPGGKTWFVPLIRKWLTTQAKQVNHLAEPFAGGAIVSLSALFDDLVDGVTLVEKDTNVAAVWQTIVDGEGPELADKIATFNVTEESVRLLFEQSIAPDDLIGRAFVTIVRNRVARGGIMAPGASLMRNGENGRGIKSRWYPETLKNRFLDLHSVHKKIRFHFGDGIKFIRDNSENENTGWFIDPSYTVAGRRLYLHSVLDHETLFEEAAKLKGPFLMTYDNADEIRLLAKKHGFAFTEIPMKNSHHAVMRELLISRDLEWVKT